MMSTFRSIALANKKSSNSTQGIFLARRCQHVRLAHTQPPVKSYRANTSPLDLIWNFKIPTSSKYFSGLLSSAYVVTHLHPNILATLGPPALVGAFFGYRYWHKRAFNNSFDKIKPQTLKQWQSKDTRIRIEKYQESDINNVLMNVENEFDNFRTQVLQLTEKRIVDFIANIKTSGETVKGKEDITRLFIDENNQFGINLDDQNIESFITVPVELPKFDKDPAQDKVNLSVYSETTKFIKLSTPFYSSKDTTTRKRLGVVEIYLLEVPTENSDPHQEFKMLIGISPFKFFVKDQDKLYIDEIKEGGIYSSDKLVKSNSRSKKDNQKNDNDYEEITVNL